MKKTLVVFGLILVLMITFVFIANAQSKTSVYCDGNLIEFEEGPYIIDGYTFVPVRGLSEALDFKYSWDDSNKTVIVTSDVASAWIQVDNTSIAVNKDRMMYSVNTDVAPCIIDNRTFIPLRAVAQLFDCVVEWDSQSKSVIITTDNNIEDKADEVIVEDDNADEEQTTRWQEGSFTIKNFTPPKKVTKGSSYILSGTVESDTLIDRVNVKIIDVETEAVEINETQFDINDDTYSISDIDSRITFGKLTLGEKIMEISCVDEYEDKEIFTFEFSVSEPHGAKVSSDVTMLWPVPSSGLITTIFWCDNAFCHSNGGRANGHSAIDIAADEGADVVAVMDGVVKLQGMGSYENGKTGYGNFILLDHGNGLETQYSHLFEIYVTDGQEVKAGEVIGAVGNTGNSTGNHLDFYITQDDMRCDPLYYLEIPDDALCWEECDVKYFEQALEARGIER